MKQIGKDFVFSTHARTQISKRNITDASVKKALNKPDSIVKEQAKTIYQVMELLNNKPYLLRVIMNDAVTPNIVITAYLTSKIGKYHESKI